MSDDFRKRKRPGVMSVSFQLVEPGSRRWGPYREVSGCTRTPRGWTLKDKGDGKGWTGKPVFGVVGSGGSVEETNDPTPSVSEEGRTS